MDEKKTIAERMREYRQRHPERIAEYERSGRRPKRIVDPEQKRAWNALTSAVRYGEIRRGPCEVCGTEEKVEAHHDDYSRPLDVRWLCRDHHEELHHPLEARPT